MEALSHSRPGEPPAHVAIIMDGNGRWASARNLARSAGHKRGADAARKTVRGALDLGVRYLTLFGFSLENWKRPPSEVDDLMGLLHWYLQSQIPEMCKNGVKLRVIGERRRLSPNLVQLIDEAESSTQQNGRLDLTVAISYGGRQEIIDAVQSLACLVVAGELDPNEIDDQLFRSQLCTSDLPDPDLVIRTSGEQRISNFLLWQSAYSELVFVDKLWPDFDEDDLSAAIQEFQSRDRRYGAAFGY